MKGLYQLNRYRMTGRQVIKDFGSEGDDKTGAFKVARDDPHDCLRVIASSGHGWDHVSVSLDHRCPTWEEMEHIKRLFFRPDETAMQLHVPELEHINNHPYCLHMWRPLTGVIQRPPHWMVGPRESK